MPQGLYIPNGAPIMVHDDPHVLLLNHCRFTRVLSLKNTRDFTYFLESSYKPKFFNFFGCK